MFNINRNIKRNPGFITFTTVVAENRSQKCQTFPFFSARARLLIIVLCLCGFVLHHHHHHETPPSSSSATSSNATVVVVNDIIKRCVHHHQPPSQPAPSLIQSEVCDQKPMAFVGHRFLKLKFVNREFRHCYNYAIYALKYFFILTDNRFEIISSTTLNYRLML